jgi:hypothetical protein
MMESFQGVLYYITRKKLSSWFIQATRWGYAQGAIIRKSHIVDKETSYTEVFVRSIKEKYRSAIPSILFSIIKLIRIAPICCRSLQYLLMLPYIYVIRRIGYYIGYRFALSNISAIKLRSKNYETEI